MKKCVIDIEVHLNEQIHPVRLKLKENKPVNIGREAKEIKLNFADVSRIHAIFLFKNDKLTLIDQQSANGTKVNGLKIDQILIQNTDVIEIGPAKIRLCRIEIIDEETTMLKTLVDFKDPFSWLTEVENPPLKDLLYLVREFYKNPLSLFDQLKFNTSISFSLVALTMMGLILGLVAESHLHIGVVILNFIRELLHPVIFATVGLIFNQYLSTPLKFRHWLSLIMMISVILVFPKIIFVFIGLKLFLLFEIIIFVVAAFSLVRIFTIPPIKGLILAGTVFFLVITVDGFLSDLLVQPVTTKKAQEGLPHNQKEEVLKLLNN